LKLKEALVTYLHKVNTFIASMFETWRLKPIPYIYYTDYMDKQVYTIDLIRILDQSFSNIYSESMSTNQMGWSYF
jgi:hypothetical protein